MYLGQKQPINPIKDGGGGVGVKKAPVLALPL